MLRGKIGRDGKDYHGDFHDGGIGDEDSAVHVLSGAEVCDVEFGHVEALEFVQTWSQSVHLLTVVQGMSEERRSTLHSDRLVISHGSLRQSTLLQARLAIDIQRDLLIEHNKCALNHTQTNTQSWNWKY